MTSRYERQRSIGHHCVGFTVPAYTIRTELVLRAVREVKEMRHGDEGVVERFDRGDPLVGVDGQHLC